MDTGSFIIHIKTEDFYKDIANDVEKRYDTSNYKVNRPLPTRKNKKEIGLMKGELGGKIMIEFVTWMMVTVIKKLREQKKCVIKRELKFKNYENSNKAT